MNDEAAYERALADAFPAVTFELYDLAADPHELVDLLIAQPGPGINGMKDRLLAMMPTFP